MPKFRIGTDSFKELIDEGGYFVDKSLLIKEVIEGSKVTLLPRPRRFGKTLNMTMLRYFFEKSEEDRSYLFHGLAIKELPEYVAYQGQYPVIYLSLKDIKGNSWEEARERLVTRIGELFTPFLYVRKGLSAIHTRSFEKILNGVGENSDLKDSLRTLIIHLHEYHGKPVVVLIDEYDSPVIEAWTKGYYEEMVDFMRSWLGGGLKHEESQALYRGVVTGILRVAKESIFSGLNNLDVATILKIGPFSEKFGFTQTELDKVLVDFDLPELAAPMEEWYNGYDFGGHTIYNPWSVIKCISEWPTPIGPHWLNTSSNALIHEELEKGGMPLKRDLEKLLAGEELRYPINEDTVFCNIGKSRDNIWSFLCFSGYLKASEPQHDPLTGDLRYRFSIPNREVHRIYRDFVRLWHESLDFSGTDNLLRSLITEDYEQFERLLSDLVRNLVSFHDAARYPEATYHAFVLGLLVNLRNVYEIRSNPESGYGRADIIMRPKTADYPLAFIIEFKSIDADGDLEQSAEKALAQIEEKAYDSQLLEAGVKPKHIRKLAVIVSGKRVKVQI